MSRYGNVNRSNVSGDERIETKLLDWDTEFGQLALISLDHVRVSLSDLLELVLDFTNRLVFELFDLFERASYHTKGLRVDARCSQYLVSLSILRFQALLYSL